MTCGCARIHFFASIAGLEYVTTRGMAGRSFVWTEGASRQQRGQAQIRADGASSLPRWPALYGLIRKCKPSVFWKRVDAAIRHGWLTRVD